MMTVDLFHTLQHTWQSLCTCYDVSAELAPVGTLFARTNVSTPDEAAQTVLVNMLSEVMESIGRFSPWYKRPASAFGIVLEHRCAMGRPEWVLTSEAIHTHAKLLDRLTAAIEQNVGVILATRFVDDLDRQREPFGPCQTACCQCTPPRTILVHNTVIADAEIICNACQQPFTLVGDPDHKRF